MPRPRTVDGGELVARTLKEFGVEVAFGLHGGHLDSLLVGLRRNGLRLIDTRHEAVAVNAADGYARVTGRLGVAFATAASGYSNAIAGLATAEQMMEVKNTMRIGSIVAKPASGTRGKEASAGGFGRDRRRTGIPYV